MVPIFLNISLYKINQKDFKNAKIHCNKILEIEKQNVKALFRRSTCDFHLNNLGSAKEDLKTLFLVDPQNKDAKILLQKIDQKLLQEKNKEKKLFGGIFEKINSDEKNSLYTEEELKERKKESENENMAVCSICNEKMEKIQLARHIIKKHGDKK